MTSRLSLVSAAILLALACGGSAAELPSAAEKSLESLAWIAGHWVGENEGAAMDEVWLPPAGGMMLGMHRDVRPGRGAFFEFMRIEVADDAIIFQASPRGAAPTPFPLVESGDRRAVFARPDHDFPQRIIYWMDGDRLRARIEGDQGGETRSSEWFFRLAPAVPK